MKKTEIYANNWEKDSTVLKKENLYGWMELQIQNYKNILEVGCGCGISTLELLSKQHNVTIIESNEACINKTRKLLSDNNYFNINIINKKLSEINSEKFVPFLENKLDLIICWNPGGAIFDNAKELSEKMYELSMLGYQDVKDNLEVFYAEDIIRGALRLGNFLGIDVHLIDRASINEGNINYLKEIAEEYNYKDIVYEEKIGKSNVNTMRVDKLIKYQSILFRYNKKLID
jgi:hypothetical protein